MNDKELMALLEIEEWEEFTYYEQFLTLMEHYEVVDEDRLFNILSKLDVDNCKSFIECYFEDLMIGIPDDNITLYKLFSTERGILLDMILVARRELAALDSLSYELLRFQRWIMKDDFLECINLNDDTMNRISIYEALICSRIELLNEGKYRLIFPNDFDYQIEEYDNASNVDCDEKDIYYDEEYEEEYEEEDLYSTMIDPENPVIEQFE